MKGWMKGWIDRWMDGWMNGYLERSQHSENLENSVSNNLN